MSGHPVARIEEGQPGRPALDAVRARAVGQHQDHPPAEAADALLDQLLHRRDRRRHAPEAEDLQLDLVARSVGAQATASQTSPMA
jgi:hypothetical protein